MKEITIELENEIEYAFKGETRKGGFISISSPTGRIAGLVGNLKTQVGGATKNSIKGLEDLKIDDHKADDTEDTPESMGEAMFAMLTMGECNMLVVMENLKEILKETASIAGEGKFTSPIFDRMAYSDIEKVLKAYLGNFISAS